ncbi:N-acetyltransferase [Psychrobacillus glaciei]|uniref:N-acetyltransferase n=1 Tax=Psychrobacillus glaciei TaxID=2283160 RepID=A0A5J6SMR0_9BACI|nr:GNAT family N-acetyltransferase [Psychrobacillus glaciei]QFF99178.1 N-acetyltransferase [Psychrobacillus glaciei]
MNIRLAERKDINQLIQMRWDFTLEDYQTKIFDESDFEAFKLECHDFLVKALDSETWFIWVAEENSKIVSHIYIELIQKVPRPGRITNPFAFMTNVYTVEGFRNKGIGSKLITTINEWVERKKYEFIIVWPSDDSIDYYKRNGYKHCKEPMEFFSS